MSLNTTLHSVDRRHPWLAPCVAIGAILALVVENRQFPAQIDDAFIVFKYARNLAHGDGFVFNLGERVEGVTTLLWTFLIAAGIRLGFAAPHVAHVLAVLSGAATLWLTFLYASAAFPREQRLHAAMAPWLVLATPAFAIWCTSGLETPLFAAVAVGALHAQARGRPTTALVISAVATLVRPEGAILAVVVAASHWHARPDERRKLAALFCAYLGFLAVLTGIRMAYFGAPLPNTFYAKVGGVVWWWGPKYLLAFVIQILWPLLLPGAFAVRERHFEGGLAWILAIASYAVLVGGDAFGHSRFFVPVLPVCSALAVRGASLAAERGDRATRFAALGVEIAAVWFVFGTLAGLVTWFVVGAIVLLLDRRWTQLIAAAVSVALVVTVGRTQRFAAPLEDIFFPVRPRNSLLLGTRFAEADLIRHEDEFLIAYEMSTAYKLATLPPADKVIASISVGVLGYSYSARVIDLVGLLDRKIARSKRRPARGDFVAPGHQRSNAAYVLSLKPDFILIPPPGDLSIPAASDLQDSDDFQVSYEWDEDLTGYRRIEPDPAE